MIRKILIKNLILIDFAEIEFTSGLNIITGESGSGKSALLSGLGLILGRRAREEIIRKDADLAYVEAFFELEHDPEIEKLLAEEGISYRSSGPFSIRREIARSGKSRCFAGDQLVSLSLLRKLGAHLMQIADQNTHEDLGSQSYQRNLLDLYAGARGIVHAFSVSFEEEKTLREKLQHLLENEAKSALENEKIRESLQEIEDAHLLPNEEEEISEEHHLLTHAQEILQKIDLIHAALYEGGNPILSKVARCVSTLEPLAKITSSFKEAYDLFKSAKIELDEAARLLLHSKGEFDAPPGRILQIEERLKVIETLKKKHGQNFGEIEEKRKALQNRQHELAHFEEEKETLEQQIVKVSEKNDGFVREIHFLRQQAAAVFQEKITAVLHDLNLLQSRLQIQIEKTQRTQTGEDAVSILFSANKGESLKEISACASGGELSRLMLSIQSVLAEKGDAHTLVFDEIDANVGGKTASMIGEKLREVSKHRQIICVTHFVQVAKFAHRHFLVKKSEKEGRTFTSIETLSKEMQKREFDRMVGI